MFNISDVCVCRNFIASALNNITTQTSKVSHFADRLHGLVHIVTRFAAAATAGELTDADGKPAGGQDKGKQKPMSLRFLAFLSSAESIAKPARYPELIRLLAEDAATAKREAGELSLSLPLAVKEKGFHLADIYLCAARLTAQNQLPAASVGTYYLLYNMRSYL
jgi:hypothetical protein